MQALVIHYLNLSLKAQQASSQQAPTLAQREEMEQKLPGLMKFFEADHPGVHMTDSVDFDVVVFGEVCWNWTTEPRWCSKRAIA
jgi:hypothetical protein